MTERTRTPQARPARERREPDETAARIVPSARIGWSDLPNRLRLALLLAVLGAGCTVLGLSLGLVRPVLAPGFSALPLLIVLAVIPVVLALGAVAVGRPVFAAGVLMGFALLAPGRAVADLQLASDALLTSRPELMVPTSLAPLSAAPGLWVLLAGHLLVALAGLLVVGTAGAQPGTAYAEELDSWAGVPNRGSRRMLIGWALACATVATAGLLLPAFYSHDAFQLTPEVAVGPVLVLGGGLLTVAAVVLGCMVFTASAMPPALTRGGLLGLLAAVAAVTMPAIVAGLAVDRLDPAPGPYVALGAIGALVLIVFLWPGGRESREPARTELLLEAHRLHLLAGALGIVAGLAAIGGGLGTQLVVDAGLEQPDSFANRQLIPAGIVVGLLAATLLVDRWSAAVRPAFTVSLASVLVVGAGTLDAALTGAGISEAVHVGAGVWMTGIAMAVAVVAAICAGVAGSAERDDVDLTERGLNQPVVVPAGAAAVLAIGAFGLPAVRAPDFSAPGIWSDFRLASWGLLLGLVVVIAVCALAPLSRPTRGASLLLGAAAVVGVHLLEFPLTSGRAAQATPGAGTWLSLACLVALLVAATAALVSRSRQR
jgi:hypothetical protein